MEQLNLFSCFQENPPLTNDEQGSHLENIFDRMENSYFGKSDPFSLNRAKNYLDHIGLDQNAISDEMNKALKQRDYNYRNLLREVIVYEDDHKGVLKGVYYPALQSDVLVPKGGKWERARVLKQAEGNAYVVRPYRENASIVIVSVYILKPC